jgi:hypothetical protein
VIEILAEVEAAGVELRLDGQAVRIWFPEAKHRDELASQIAFLRRHRGEVAKSLPGPGWHSEDARRCPPGAVEPQRAAGGD